MKKTVKAIREPQCGVCLDTGTVTNPFVDKMFSCYCQRKVKRVNKKAKVRTVRAWAVISQNDFIMAIELGAANAEQECRLYNGKMIKRGTFTYTLPNPRKGRK